MKSALPSRLEDVLRLKAEGYTNATIAEKLVVSKATVDTYAKRLIQHFKDAEMWDPSLSPKVGLAVIARRYFDELREQQSTNPLDGLRATRVLTTDFIEVLSKYLERDQQVREKGDPELASSWATANVEQLAGILKRAHPESSRTATIVLAHAHELSANSWTEAIPWYRVAEVLFGPGRSQAASVACTIANRLVNLGDYDKAREEHMRVEEAYMSVMDPATQTQFIRTKALLHYQQSQLLEAEQLLKQAQTIGSEVGDERLADPHLLGRVYSALVKASGNTTEAERWFHLGIAEFAREERLIEGIAVDEVIGFNLFRRAQLLRAHGKWRDAKRFRVRARRIFGTDPAILHVDLEEARLALKDNEDRSHYEALLITATDRWAQAKYAKGMAEALQLLGDLNRREGKTDLAFQSYAAALCLLPFEGTASHDQLWADISELLHERDEHTVFARVRQIEELATSRKGYFSYLNHLATDRSEYITRIMDRMKSV